MTNSTDDNLVHPEYGCPLCGERCTDRLEQLDEDRVLCTMCGAEYVLLADEDDCEDSAH